MRRKNKGDTTVFAHTLLATCSSLQGRENRFNVRTPSRHCTLGPWQLSAAVGFLEVFPLTSQHSKRESVLRPVQCTLTWAGLGRDQRQQLREEQDSGCRGLVRRRSSREGKSWRLRATNESVLRQPVQGHLGRQRGNSEDTRAGRKP